MDDIKISEGVMVMSLSNLKIQETEESLDDSYFTKSEILEIVTVIKANYMHLIWFKLLYSFGMTLHDLVNLRVKDVDFEKAKLLIHTSRKLTPRCLDIPKSLLCDLRIHCSHKFPDSYVFHGRSGRLHTRTIQKALEKVESKLNIQLTVAKIRKSIAVHLLQSGWDYSSIGTFLGHANYRATRTLLGPDPRPYRKLGRLPLDEILQ